MADDILVTPSTAGNAVTVAADDVGGKLFQRVKLTAGADGSATDVSAANPLPVIASATDANGNGTREYNFAAATRTGVGATSSTAVAIGTLGASREVMLVASTRCFVKFGTSAVADAGANDSASLALPADAMFHLRIPAGVTHFKVIRDTADGFFRCIPVA